MKLIVAVTGASGVEMSYYLVRALKAMPDCEVHLVMSEGAKLTWKLESAIPLERLTELADYQYEDSDLAAVISSGSYRTDGMIVMPCSMKSLAGIVCGYADNLVQRVADVCMKEGRKLVLVPREMPMSRLHLRNLLTASELGCVIIPPVLTFYSGARTMEEQIDHIVGKILMQFGLDFPAFRPWQGTDGNM